MECGHAYVEVDHELLVHGAYGRVESHVSQELRAKRPSLLVVEEVAITAESKAALGCVTLHDHV